MVVSSPASRRTSAATIRVSSGSTAVLSVQQCDSAAQSDAAGLALGLHSSGMQVSSLVHAAGVLKVSAAS